MSDLRDEDTNPENTDSTEDDPSSGRSRRRWLRRLAALVVFLPLLWLGLVNGFLYFAPGLLFSADSRTWVDWRRAWCVLPGTIHLRDAEVSGRSGRGTWRIDFERTRLEHGFVELFGRSFVADAVIADGVAFTWREADGTIAGGIDAPEGAPPERPPREDRGDDEPTPWKLVFAGIRLDGLHTVLLGSQRLDATESPGTVKGRFEIETKGGPARVPRMSLELDEARVLVDSENVGTIERLAIDGRIDTFRPREHRGMAILDFVTAGVELRADGWGFELVRHYFRAAPVEIEGDGFLDARLEIEKGRLRPRTKLQLEGEDLEVRYLDLVAHGDGRIDGGVVEGEEAVRLELVLEPFTAGKDGASPHLRSGATGLRLEARSPTLDITDPKPVVRAELRLEKAEIPDFSVYQAMLPEASPLRLVSGRGEIDLHLVLDTSTGAASGDIRVAASNVRASYQDTPLRGDLRLDTRLVEGDPESLRFRLADTRLEIDDVRVTGKDGEPWWARVEIPQGEATLSEPLDLEARFSAKISDPRPLVTVLAPAVTRVPYWTRLLAVRSVTASGTVRFDRRHWTLRDLELEAGDRFRGRAQLRLGDESVEGVALVEIRPIRFGLEAEPGGARHLELRHSREWYAERERVWRRRLAGPASGQAGN